MRMQIKAGLCALPLCPLPLWGRAWASGRDGGRDGGDPALPDGFLPLGLSWRCRRCLHGRSRLFFGGAGGTLLSPTPLKGRMWGWLWTLGFGLAMFLLSVQAPPAMAEGDGLVSVDYEVFGKVQGVFFRKYTQAEGKKLGLVGWVQNTDDGTVQGQIQGPVVKIVSSVWRLNY
ncbi:hypothetical protein JRQ81_000960 [Phrynocephalus forsythii]|uniref:Acylphosphatase n=1 Tax=Phrynocephalus forsythii TaxID=171643 RepID=A0A9Q0Y6A4_9SAUR|nr:hypothetical protein JRQ81_000960 [Phrynocephalus forsythii]